MKVTSRFLDRLEEQIRTNSAPKLKDLIKFNRNRIPRRLVARYANLLRRLGATKHALTILNPIVRNNFGKPSTEEAIEYASCLCRLDLVDEGIALLTNILNDSRPEIYLELAIAYMTKWEYQDAIPFLLRYLKFENLTPYKVCVGEINLAASYLFTEDKDSAELILKNLLAKVKEKNFSLLWGNALELLGEVYLSRKKYDLASQCFRDCGDRLVGSDPRYQLYLERWKVIIKMLKENGSEESLNMWRSVRKQSAEIFDWNSLRELELYKAVVTNDAAMIKSLYFGVPYPGYRRRILSIWGKPIESTEKYDRKIGRGKALPNKVLDIKAGRDLFTGRQLKPGLAVHRLLQVLASDFYAPFLTEKIFSQVFKGQFFNPITSPLQVRQLINRLNKWFVSNKIPFSVKRSIAGYRIRADEAYIIRTPASPITRTRVDDFVSLLEHHGLVEDFSAKMVIEKLGLSRRSAIRLLSEGVTSGKIIRRGRAKSTVYEIAEWNPTKLSKPYFR